jgi:hypothetical protein
MLVAADSLFDNQWFQVARNAGILLTVVFWLAIAFWVLKDARRRIDDPWLVGLAALLGLVPFLGAIVYLFFRPPEYLDEVRERELEIAAMEEHVERRDLRCPVCRGRVQSDYLVCPICTTRMKHACEECKAPLEPIWQACPYCATPVPSAAIPEDVLQPLRPERR